MMRGQLPKHPQLSRELADWWQGQKSWRTRSAFARTLSINEHTMNDYFLGRSFPQDENRTKLYRHTHIPRLAPMAEPGPSPKRNTMPPGPGWSRNALPPMGISLWGKSPLHLLRA